MENGVKSLPPDKARLNLVLDKDLKDWAMKYAKRQHTRVTQMIVDYFSDLQEKEKGVTIEQI